MTIGNGLRGTKVAPARCVPASYASVVVLKVSSESSSRNASGENLAEFGQLQDLHRCSSLEDLTFRD